MSRSFAISALAARPLTACFFSSEQSLPCSLWFFDKGKKEALRNTVLFIDARNYYAVVDRTLNEWSEWQLKNLNAIVWLYRGEVDKYQNLLSEYRQELGEQLSFPERAKQLETDLQNARAEAKEKVSQAARRDKKRIEAEYQDIIQGIEQKLAVAKETLWLAEKFGEGVYQDIPGLCKAATLEEIEQKGFSLTPGAYVGVPPAEDDGVDFHERMTEIHKELLKLQAKSDRLMETISKNWEEMGL